MERVHTFLSNRKLLSNKEPVRNLLPVPNENKMNRNVLKPNRLDAKTNCDQLPALCEACNHTSLKSVWWVVMLFVSLCLPEAVKPHAFSHNNQHSILYVKWLSRGWLAVFKQLVWRRWAEVHCKTLSTHFWTKNQPLFILTKHFAKMLLHGHMQRRSAIPYK